MPAQSCPVPAPADAAAAPGETRGSSGPGPAPLTLQLLRTSSRSCPCRDIVNPEKRTWERRSMGVIRTVADTVGVKLVEKLIDEICEGTKKEREAEATKPQESWMKEDFQELIQQMKAMREDLQKGQESSKCDIQLLIEGLKKELGKTEKKNTPNPQGSGSEETLLQFCKQMKTMCEDLQKGQESTKQDIQLLRADLNKELDRKMKKMAKAQESKMDKKLQQLFQRILERELHGRQHILQLPRAEMEIEQGVLIESASEDEGTDVDA
ncbi:uncharacterized protein LOC135406068 isoform X1 [Pseudopipra pipra]|uniref:uncharacterized protein LOC135406068 isoform X1 n=1 Tax=Pseudopipra pipra TaxID=415032 RepID=UPI0031390864